MVCFRLQKNSITLPRMDLLMSPTIIDSSKRLPTSRTRKRPIPKMTPLMTLQINIPRKALIADIARKFARNLSPT